MEQQEIQNNLRENEITRLSRRAAELSKRVVKEKVRRESIVQDITYSNPAKLMNYMKVQKAKNNSSFRSLAEYVSHVDAYERTQSSEVRDQGNDTRRLKFAKLLAQKRLNQPQSKTLQKPPSCVPKPPQKEQKVQQSTQK